MRSIVAPLLIAALASAGRAELPPGAFGWMGELAGACWSATYPDGTRDTQCYRDQYGRFLRGTIEIAPPEASQPYRGDSVLAWDPAAREIRFTYWGSLGNVGTMTGRLEQDRIVFSGAGEPGTPATRTAWKRLDADGFEVVQQRRQREGEDWTDVLTLVYRRDLSSAPTGH